MLFGTDGIFKIPFENYNFAGQICSVALIFIMFYGGFGTRWSEAKPVAARAILLSLVAAVLREGQTVVPKGDTVLKDGEMVVLGAEGYKDRKHVFLYEITVDSNHK